nr:hypothetical protein [Nocardia wallacei]
MAGGDRLCDLAANEARYVEQLLDHGSYTDRVGKALTGAAAEMMTAASWVHGDAGRWPAARRYYADAAQAATTAGDGIAAAHRWINACLLSYREGFTRVGDRLPLGKVATESYDHPAEIVLDDTGRHSALALGEVTLSPIRRPLVSADHAVWTASSRARRDPTTTCAGYRRCTSERSSAYLLTWSTRLE